MKPPLLHLTTRDRWEAARAMGEYCPPSLETDGFLHLSAPEQVLIPANARYRGRDDIVLLVLAQEQLTAPVRWEDLYGHGAFPHLYGPLNLDAVVEVHDFLPGPEGEFSLPPGIL